MFPPPCFRRGVRSVQAYPVTVFRHPLSLLRLMGATLWALPSHRINRLTLAAFTAFPSPTNPPSLLKTSYDWWVLDAGLLSKARAPRRLHLQGAPYQWPPKAAPKGGAHGAKQ